MGVGTSTPALATHIMHVTAFMPPVALAQADWENLRWSVTGLLNSNMWGIALAGADICGFMGDTDEELCSRCKPPNDDAAAAAAAARCLHP